jgi:hypothetical protein
MGPRAFAVTNLRLVAADLTAFAEQITADLAADLQLQLMKATPIDTSNARSGWTTTKGNPPTSHHGSKRAPNWNPFFASLLMLGTYKLQDGILYITNLVDYIGDTDAAGLPGLDAGWSPQAPAGFISLTIRKVLQRVRRYNRAKPASPLIGTP